MNEFSDECLDVFLEKQEQLFDEPVAETREEAEEFLEECMAQVVPTLKDVREWLDEAGMDAVGLSDEELLDQAEVFEIPGEGYLIVEG